MSKLFLLLFKRLLSLDPDFSREKSFTYGLLFIVYDIYSMTGANQYHRRGRLLRTKGIKKNLDWKSKKNALTCGDVSNAIRRPYNVMNVTMKLKFVDFESNSRVIILNAIPEFVVKVCSYECDKGI